MIKCYCDICGIETKKAFKLQDKLVILLNWIFGDLGEYIFYTNVCLKCQIEIKKSINNKIKELKKGVSK
jgi:hypothetical protein